MKKYLLFVLYSFITLYLNGQDFEAQMTKAVRDGDKVKQQEILSEWAKYDNKTVDFYLWQFHFNEQYCIDYTTGKLDIELLGKSLDILDNGIAKYEKSFDLRHLKINTLFKYGLFDDYVQEIIKTIDYSYLIDNKWWSKYEKIDDSIFFNYINSYQGNLFDEIDFENYSKQDTLMSYRIKLIAQQILKYYPNNIDALNNQAITYFFDNDFTMALNILCKAENLNPKDETVLFNIANIYAKQGDKQKAEQYYKKIINNCDSKAQEQAKQLLKELN